MYVFWLHKDPLSVSEYINIHLYFVWRRHTKCISNPPFYVYSGPTYAFILIHCCYDVRYSARRRSQSSRSPHATHLSQLPLRLHSPRRYYYYFFKWLLNGDTYPTVLNGSPQNTLDEGRDLVEVWNRALLNYYNSKCTCLNIRPSAVKQSNDRSQSHRTYSIAVARS